MADKGLNLFDECAAGCVHLCPQEEESTSSSCSNSKMYTPGTIANAQTGKEWKKNKNGAVAKVNVGGNTDTIRDLKKIRVTSNEMLVLRLILDWCYFTCLQMYSDKFFNVYFYEQMCFGIFVAKGDTGQFLFWNNSLNSQIFINIWRSWF